MQAQLPKEPMLARRIYYAMKPVVPWPIRIALRRWRASQIRKKSEHVWPISNSAGKPPPNWSGWPNGKKFAVVLTHDVEGKRGYDKVGQLAEMEKRLGFRSSFNFVPEGEYRVQRTLREELERGGFEVGVHDLHHDGKLYNSQSVFRKRAQRINTYLREWNAVGFRSAFMLHNLDWLGELDVLYDASTFDSDPFEPQPGGVDTIFPFWVPGKNRKGFVELPYTLAQDSTLFLILCAPDIEIWRTKIDWIAERGGMVLVNVHPDYLHFEKGVPERATFLAAHYEALLGYFRQRYEGDFWAPLPKDLAKWFKGQYESKAAAAGAEVLKRA